MSKNIEAKKQIVDGIASELKSSASNAYVFNYSQIGSNQINNLRRSLEEKSSAMKVVKNTLITRIAESVGVQVEENLKGQNLLIIPGTDFVSPLKELFKFMKDNAKGGFKFGILDGKFISASEIESLSKLPSREVLLGQVVGTMQAPVRNFAVVLNGVQTKFARTLEAVRAQKAN